MQVPSTHHHHSQIPSRAASAQTPVAASPASSPGHWPNGHHHSDLRHPQRAPLAEQATAWAEHALALSTMRAAYVYRKALDSVRFSQLAQRSHLAIPSKLVGTRECQAELAGLHASGAPSGLPLAWRSDGLFFGAHYVGQVQDKHQAWLMPLVPHGAVVKLHAVTGTDEPRKYHGLNVTFEHVPSAIAAYAARETGARMVLPDVYLWADEQARTWLQVGTCLYRPDKCELGTGSLCGAVRHTARLILKHYLRSSEAEQWAEAFARDMLADGAQPARRIPGCHIVRWLGAKPLCTPVALRVQGGEYKSESRVLQVREPAAHRFGCVNCQCGRHALAVA